MPFTSTLRGRSGPLRPSPDLSTTHRTASHPAAIGTVETESAVAPAATARVPRRLGRRPVLDGLRGIAVLLVITEHTGLIQNGFMGVDVFFVLSGFLITTLLFEEWERRGSISLQGFYVRRARRLLPAMVLLALIAITVNLFAYRLTGWGIGLKLASTFGFANNWVAGLSLDDGNALGAINPTWSLAQEEQFYLLWPIALIVLLRIGARPRWIFALLVAAIASLLCAEPAIAARLPNYSPYYSPVDRAAELLLGCAGSVLWRHRMVWLPGEGLSFSTGPLNAALRVAVEAAGLGLAFAFGWLLLKTDPVNSRWVFLGAAGIALPGLLLLVQCPHSLLGRAVCVAPLRAVGKISYCVYLVHLLIRNLMLSLLPGITNPWEIAALTVSSSLLVAALSLRYIETPIRQGRFTLFSFLQDRLDSRERRPPRARCHPAPQRTPRPIRSSA